MGLMSLIDCKNGLELLGIMRVIGIIGFHCLTEINGGDKLQGFQWIGQPKDLKVTHCPSTRASVLRITRLGRTALFCYSVITVVIGCIPFIQ